MNLPTELQKKVRNCRKNYKSIFQINSENSFEVNFHNNGLKTERKYVLNEIAKNLNREFAGRLSKKLMEQFPSSSKENKLLKEIRKKHIRGISKSIAV